MIFRLLIGCLLYQFTTENVDVETTTDPLEQCPPGMDCMKNCAWYQHSICTYYGECVCRSTIEIECMENDTLPCTELCGLRYGYCMNDVCVCGDWVTTTTVARTFNPLCPIDDIYCRRDCGVKKHGICKNETCFCESDLTTVMPLPLT